MSGPVNGSSGANMGAEALRSARWGMAWLHANGPDHANASRIRAATVSEYGRVLRHSHDPDACAEARQCLDDFQRQVFERELERWWGALRDHGFVDGELDDETAQVLAQARLDDLPDRARWSRHRR